nr:protein Wnt-16-like [Procambarus clarkii]
MSNTTPAGNIVVNTTPAGNIVVNTTPASNIAVNTTPASNIVVNTTPAGNIVVNTTPAGNIVVNTTPASNIVVNTTPASNIVVNTTPAGNIAVNTTPAGNIVVNTTPAGNIVVNTTPAGNIVVNTTLAGNIAVNTTPAGNIVVNTTPAGNIVVNTTPAGNIVVNTTPASNIAVNTTPAGNIVVNTTPAAYPDRSLSPAGSKETAFIYAVTSAGVVHAVTHACSSGNLTDCSCDMSKQGLSTPEGWKWGGCSDNLRFGVQFARQFVDAPEKERHKKFKRRRNLMNLHNNEAGREAVARLMKMQCRCHGVSGSCELKTCWRSIPTFPVVGDYLKNKYKTALRYKRKKRSSSSGRRDSRRRRRRRGRRKRRFLASKEELVHIHKSPNYCVQNLKKGILGTHGRFCNKTSNGADSCDLLCCGRGYNTQVVRYVERCHCKFVWCCHVKCKTCVTNVDVHTCK